MAVPGLQQRSLTKSGIQAPPPGRAVLCPRPSGCRHPPVLTQHSAVFARVQEPRMAQKPAPTRKSRCAPWVEQTFEKNRALLAVLAERSEAVAPIGAWVECPSPCGEEAPASVSASQLEEEFKEQQRLKEEALKRFQEQVKNRVNQQVRLRKKQQLQKSFEAVEKESTVAMQSSSLAPHLTPKGRANIFQSNLKSAIRSFDSNLPIQTLGDIEKKEEDENGAFQQQALALSQTLKQARQQLASRKTIDGEKPLGFSEDSMESSPTQEIALLRQPTSLRTGERGRKDSPLKDHPDQLLPAQASIRDQAEQKEEEREQQKKTCIRQLSAVSANGKRIEKPLPYHISGKIQAQETAENTNFGQLVTVSADGKETEKLLPYHLPDKVQAQETAEKPYFGQLLAAGSDDEETEKSLPYHILGNIQAQETAEIFTVDTTSEGRSKTFPVESYREQGVPYADVREEKKKPHFGLELSAVGADGKETERPLPYYIPGNIQSQETAEKSYFGQPLTVGTNGKRSEKPLPYHIPGKVQTQETEEKPFFGQLSTVGADGKGTEKPFPYHIPGKVQFQETAEKPYFGQLSIVGADGKGTEKPFPYHIPGKVQAQETAEKPYFGQLSTVGADGKGTEKPFPYHIPGKVQAQETAELSTVGANSKGTKKSLPYYIPGNIQAQETIENTNFGQPSAVSADVKGTEKPLPYHIPGKVQVQETAEKPYFGQLLTVGTNSKGTKKPLPSHIPGKVQAWETAEKPYFGQLSAADADGKGTEKPLPYHISGKIQAQETAEKPHFGQLSAVGADGKGTEKPLSYHIQGKIQAQETAEVYGGPQSGSRSEFQNLPLFECGIDQEEDKKARQKQYLRYRRLFMDIERQQVKELERQRKFRKKIERVKKWKEQQRCIEEQKILRKTCQEDLDSGVKTCEISADSKLEDKKGAIKKHQRSRECIRYIEALRAQIQEKMRLYNIDLPPLCCCGPDFWDAHPDTCANNCIFYKNHQAYTQALHSVISSCEISENNSSMRLAIHNFASARRRNWKIQ